MYISLFTMPENNFNVFLAFKNIKNSLINIKKNLAVFYAK